MNLYILNHHLTGEEKLQIIGKYIQNILQGTVCDGQVSHKKFGQIYDGFDDEIHQYD